MDAVLFFALTWATDPQRFTFRLRQTAPFEQSQEKISEPTSSLISRWSGQKLSNVR